MLGVAEKVMLLLPDRVGSLFSYASLAQDVQVSIQTIQKWLYNFERLYIVFKLKLYTKNITRSINKRPKYYLWNWADVEDPGARFENFIASHLLKAAQTWSALGLATVEVHYIQDRLNKEVDFLVTKNLKPWFLLEAKGSDVSVSPSLLFFSKKLGVPGIQLVEKSNVFQRFESGIVCSADRWLGLLA